MESFMFWLWCLKCFDFGVSVILEVSGVSWVCQKDKKLEFCMVGGS